MRGLVSVLTIAACLAAPTVASAQDAASAPVAQEAAAQEAVTQPEEVHPEAATASVESYDPWEGFNRAMFGVHRAVDGALLEPVARGYRAITPRPLRTGVLNFLRNLRSPVILANDVLQGEIKRAGTTAGRFAINTTVGVAGVFDPATSIGLERHDEDFGQTLAVWGVPSGPYLFVPLLGPTTIRDAGGRVVDVAFDPITWAEFDDIDTFRAARAVTSAIAAREVLLNPIDSLEAQGGDLYISYRSAFEVSREAAIRNGRTDLQDLPEFETIDENPETETPDGGGSAEANQQHADVIQLDENSVVFSETLAVPTSLGN